MMGGSLLQLSRLELYKVKIFAQRDRTLSSPEIELTTFIKRLLHDDGP